MISLAYKLIIRVRYIVEDHGSDGYYYLLPKKPEKPKITVKTTEGSALLNWQFLKYKRKCRYYFQDLSMLKYMNLY